MELYNYSNYNKVWVVGDIHGRFNDLLNRIRSLSSTKEELENHLEKIRKNLSKKKAINKCNDTLNDSIIIVSGDYGLDNHTLNTCQETLERLNNHLTNINSHLFLIRGNHDNPNIFDDKTINFTNLKAISDYSVIVTSDENILCIGGAISIDRTWRIAQEQHINKHNKNIDKKLYWENEAPIFDEIALTNIFKSGMDINFVVTHSAPSFAFPKHKNGLEGWCDCDTNLISDIECERKIFDKVYDFLLENNMGLKGWFYGHFHENYVTKSKDFIPFASMQDDFHFHNIYENENDGLLQKEKASLFSRSLPHFDPRPLNLDLPRLQVNEAAFAHENELIADNNDDIFDDAIDDEPRNVVGYIHVHDTLLNRTRELGLRAEQPNPYDTIARGIADRQVDAVARAPF